MKESLLIPHKPFSINSTTYRDKRHKTQEFKNWCHTILHYLNNEKNLEALKKLRESFNSSKQYYIVHIDFYFPQSYLFTKAGACSGRAFDLSNIEKTLIDLIFLPYYFDKEPPYGAKNLNIDDKFILKLGSTKLPAEKHRIEVQIEIQDLESLPDPQTA